jgi:hypothetical protein
VDPNCTVRDSRAPQRHRRSEFVAFSEIVTRAPQRGQTNVSVLQPRSWESCGGSLIGLSGSGAWDGVPWRSLRPSSSSGSSSDT